MKTFAAPICSDCGKGTLETIDLGIKYLEKCTLDGCGFRRTYEK